MENIILAPDVLAAIFLLCLKKRDDIDIPRDITQKILEMTAEPTPPPYVRSKRLQGYMDRWAQRAQS